MKKVSNIIKIISFSTVLIILLTIKSNAAIQMVPTESVLTNVTVSTSYKTCRDLDSLSSTLGTTKLDPHLATNKDWGAVSYLANSAYGLNATYTDIDTQEGKVGVKKTINSIDFYSTTPNVTGVMNWGGNPNKKMYTQTAGLYVSASERDSIKILYDNINTKYVEKIGGTGYSDAGMARTETESFIESGHKKWSGDGQTALIAECPLTVRSGLFGCGYSSWYGSNLYARGESSDAVTFRPVIWNIE